MNFVPRSSSQLFNSKKQKPQPKAKKQRDEKPSHQITVEPRKKAQQAPLTPFDIQKSYTPTTQYTIDRCVKKSISFSKNGIDLFIPPSVSETDLAQQLPTSPSVEFPVKQFYTIEDMISMKPQSYTTKLMTPGFIMLLHLKSMKQHQNQSDQIPKKKKPQRKQPSTAPVKLAEHEGDRFISSVATKAVGLYDERSPEALRAAAQRILNKLNTKNIPKSVQDIRNLGISQESLIELLLDRATMDTEFPERNLQLTNFISYAIDYANTTMGFGELLVSMSYDAAEKLIGETQTVPIASFQCMAVWLSALYNAGLGAEYALYQFFLNVMKNEPKERAIDVIRCGMYICGKKVGPNFEIFFKFLKDHPSHFGYKRFLVEELFTLRENKWDRRALDPKAKPQTTGLKIETTQRRQETKEDPHDVDDAMTLENEFRSWLNEEEIQFTKFRPEQIIRLTLRQLPRHFKDANDFVLYAASCLSNISKDSGKIVDIINDYYHDYLENVRVEESPGLWTLFFMQLSAYMVEGLVKFKFIHEMIVRTLTEEQRPRMKNAVFKIAEITGAPIEDVLNLMSAMPEDIKTDPEFIQGCVALAEYTVPEDTTEIEAGKIGVVHAGVIIRDAVVAALQEEEEDPIKSLEPKKDVFKSLFEIWGRNMVNVAKHVIDMYQFPMPRREELICGIEKNIFCTE